MIRANYYCSQAVLYVAAAQILRSFSENISAFATFKSRYDNGFLSRAQMLLTQAENLPDHQVRNTRSETNYLELNRTFGECAALWQRLKRYIQAAYPIAEHKLRLEQAGSLYYKKANLKNRDAARNLLLTAQKFLASQQVTLLAGQNMPPDFRTNFVKTHANFSRLMLVCQQSEKKSRIETLQKLEANNSLFALITEICLDGQQLFRNEQILRSQFTFSTILTMISSPKKSTRIRTLVNRPHLHSYNPDEPTSHSEFQSPSEGSKG